ncbi:MAG: hypothetical protein HY048_17120 [Acidobacteria bacterium]|nr:hypothetical protein [Acidobacteriota bacterium]
MVERPSVDHRVAVRLAWLNKERVETPVTVSIFLALGAAATIGGVLRGHLVFTERMNRAHLAVERRRAARPIVLIDISIGALLSIDGVIIAATGALSAVFTISLALGIVLAALVLEPATTAAAFGDGSEN